MTQTAWTTADVRVLVNCAEAGLSAKQTANIIGRSLISIRAKARHSGLNFTSRATPPKGPAILTAEDEVERDAGYVAAVLRANVYGFGRTILVHPTLPARRGKSDLRLIGGSV